MSGGRKRQVGKGKGSGRRIENNRIYAFPLPLLLESQQSLQWSSFFLGLLNPSAFRIVKPQIEGIFDAATRSVWVLNSSDAMLLWRRGFFGKGNLSRSEPSWLARQVNQRELKARGGVCDLFFPQSFLSSWSSIPHHMFLVLKCELQQELLRKKLQQSAERSGESSKKIELEQ